VTPEKLQGAMGTTLASTTGPVTAAQALGVEILLGFVLVLTVFAVCDPHRPECKPIAALAIGLSVALGHLATVSEHMTIALTPEIRNLCDPFIKTSYFTESTPVSIVKYVTYPCHVIL